MKCCLQTHFWCGLLWLSLICDCKCVLNALLVICIILYSAVVLEVVNSISRTISVISSPGLGVLLLSFMMWKELGQDKKNKHPLCACVRARVSARVRVGGCVKGREYIVVSGGVRHWRRTFPL